MFRNYCHIIPQIIKSKLIVCSIGYITAILDLSLLWIHTSLNHTYRETKKFIYLAHPFFIPSCKIIIDSNKVNTFTCKCIKIKRHGSNQCFTFTRCHLYYRSLMKNYCAHKLNIEGNHIPFLFYTCNIPFLSKQSPCRLFYQSKCLNHQIIKCFTFVNPFFEFLCLLWKILISESP